MVLAGKGVANGSAMVVPGDEVANGFAVVVPDGIGGL